MDNNILSIYFLNHPQPTYSGRAVNALSFFIHLYILIYCKFKINRDGPPCNRHSARLNTCTCNTYNLIKSRLMVLLKKICGPNHVQGKI